MSNIISPEFKFAIQLEMSDYLCSKSCITVVQFCKKFINFNFLFAACVDVVVAFVVVFTYITMTYQ